MCRHVLLFVSCHHHHEWCCLAGLSCGRPLWMPLIACRCVLSMRWMRELCDMHACTRETGNRTRQITAQTDFIKCLYLFHITQIAALVAKRILCMHGGLSPELVRWGACFCMLLHSYWSRTCKKVFFFGGWFEEIIDFVSVRLQHNTVCTQPEWMPLLGTLACVKPHPSWGLALCTPYACILCSLDKIKTIERPCTVPDFGILCDILWSDPEPQITVGPHCDRMVYSLFVCSFMDWLPGLLIGFGRVFLMNPLARSARGQNRHWIQSLKSIPCPRTTLPAGLGAKWSWRVFYFRQRRHPSMLQKIWSRPNMSSTSGMHALKWKTSPLTVMTHSGAQALRDYCCALTSPQ